MDFPRPPPRRPPPPPTTAQVMQPDDDREEGEEGAAEKEEVEWIAEFMFLLSERSKNMDLGSQINCFLLNRECCANF